MTRMRIGIDTDDGRNPWRKNLTYRGERGPALPQALTFALVGLTPTDRASLG